MMNMNRMKKEYITPSIMVVEMEELCLVAGSWEDGGEVGGDPQKPPTMELSQRRRNWWNEVEGGW